MFIDLKCFLLLAFVLKMDGKIDSRYTPFCQINNIFLNIFLYFYIGICLIKFFELLLPTYLLPYFLTSLLTYLLTYLYIIGVSLVLITTYYLVFFCDKALKKKYIAAT